MFSLSVSDHVMIAHSFADPFFGPAQRLHGATYSVELSVHTPTLGPHEVVMDIGALRQILRAVLAAFEYSNLDQHPAFQGRLSTTERVAEYVARRVADEIERVAADGAPPRPTRLTVLLRESPVAWASFELELAARGGA